MAHKKAGGSTSNIRDSRGQRLGVKLFAGQQARAGSVLVRQRGTSIRPGVNVRSGKDKTLFATESGIVAFRTRKLKNFAGKLKTAKLVDVIPAKKSK